MEITLDKRTNIITENIQPGDYFVINPFNPDGSFGLEEMDVIVDIATWNTDSNSLYFYVPQIEQLPLLNFRINFTSYTNWNEFPSPWVIIAGNDSDSWDYGYIVQDGVMSWTPQSADVSKGTYGWWLVDQPNKNVPLGLFTPVEPGIVARTASEDTSTTIGGPEAFKALTAKFKK